MLQGEKGKKGEEERGKKNNPQNASLGVKGESGRGKKKEGKSVGRRGVSEGQGGEDGDGRGKNGVLWRG